MSTGPSDRTVVEQETVPLFCSCKKCELSEQCTHSPRNSGQEPLQHYSVCARASLHYILRPEQGGEGIEVLRPLCG